MRMPRSFPVTLFVVAGCFRSVAIESSIERDASVDAVASDVPSFFDGGSRAACVAPDTFTFACDDVVSTPWGGTTPAGPIMIVESLEQAEASGITECPTDITLRWSISAGGLVDPKGSIVIHIVAIDALPATTLDARDTCTLSYTAPGSGTTLSTACSFTGCFFAGSMDHAAGIAGTVHANEDGFAIDVPITVPICPLVYCL